MTSGEIREKFLKFFEKRGHAIVPSAPLVPENDPTTLFTGSGMQPILLYLLGEKHPAGSRIADSQKCFRAQDIEEVGDNRHTTFFEMLGNWSLGDYWKKEQLSWVFEFLTKEIGIPKEKLSVTCFEGEEKLGLLKDTESAEIWKSLGLPSERIHFYGTKKNWWSRAGVPENMPVGEPGGPDSEIFYEFTQVEHDPKFGKKCHPNCDCGRFMEIGNSVFMEYRKTEKGFEKLLQKNVDFGGGLERTTAAANNNPDVFRLDAFEHLIQQLEQISSKKYAQQEYTPAFRIIADHVRASIALISDGVVPSNVEGGYYVRRLIRRSIYNGGKLGIDRGFFTTLLNSLHVDSGVLIALIQEEEKSRLAIKNATEVMKKILSAKGYLDTRDWFQLYQTHGMMKEFMIEQVRDFNAIVEDSAKHNVGRIWEFNEREFDKLVEGHQEISRKGVEKKFKGGLADTSEMSLKYHTATHLLHTALREVLGRHVEQKGSNITPERLRFDFSHTVKMAEEEKKKVEDLVNAKIKEALPVTRIVLSKEEALKTGALHFFGEKYGNEVSVYYIGENLKDAYSKEFCGGPHVTNTKELGVFNITKEEAVSAGVRRIKATLG